MTSALRSISAVLMGFVTGFVIMVGCEFANIKLFPLPPGADLTDPASLNAAMANMPGRAMVMVLVGWAVGTFGASFAATRFAPQLRALHGMILGLIFMGGAIINMREFHHPLWFWIIGVLIFLPAAYFGAVVAAPRDRATGAR